jgi:hypothetical protein
MMFAVTAGPPTSTVYGAPRRRPHPLVLVALGVLALGVLTGTMLAFQAMGSGEPPVTSASFAASGPPASPVTTSRPASPTAAPSTPPSSAPPTRPATPPQQVSGMQGQGSGLCLDVQPDQPGAGGLLVLAACAPGTPSQRWQFTADGRVINGATGLCLSVAGAVPDDGGRVQQEACGDGTNQRWQVAFAADTGVSFAAAHSGRCLDVTGGAAVPGTPVQQYTCNNTPAQRWFLQPG